MIDVTAHIRELLFKHDCVILPLFGGFIGNYRPAQIDSSTNTFSPPVKAISFNRNLTHNDGLLIGKISEERKTGYAESKRLVDDFVAGIRKRLERGDRITFEMIGYFQTNKEGNIEFEPDRDSNFLLDSYGFSSFRRDPLPGYDVTRRLTGRDKDSVKNSVSRKMAWRAAIAAPFIAAMIIVPLKTDLLRNNASLNPLSSVELSRGDSATEKSELNVVTESPLIDPEVVLLEAVEEEVTATFSIVTGSFKSRDNALRMLNEAEEKGFTAELTPTDNGFYRVLLSSSASKEEALILRNKVREIYPDCWILTR